MRGRRLSLSFRWLAALLLAMSASAHAATPALACPDRMLELAPSVMLLKDPAGTLSAEQVLQMPAHRFQPATARRLEPGLSNATWWLRVSLRNDLATACERWLLVGPARLRNVRMAVEHGGHLTAMQHGPSYPVHEWSLPTRRPMFPVNVAAGETVHIAIRVVGLHQQVAFTPQLWQPQAYNEAMSAYDLLDSAVFGAMLLLVLGSITMSWAFRRPALLYLALSVFCYTGYVVVASNYGFVLIWPEAPKFNAWMRMLLICLTFWTAYKYMCEVVRIRQLGPLWHYGFVAARAGFLILGLVGSLIAPALAKGSMLALADVCRIALTLGLILGMWRGLVRSWFPPLLLLLLWLQHLLLFTHLLGGSTSYSPSSEMFTTTVLPSGILLLLITTLEVKKGYRREQRAKAALHQLRESERTRLEHEVATRTGELQRALHARSTLLARISHDLRSPLAGIVDATRQWRAGAGKRDYPGIIERSATQQMVLIDELLEFSRDELAKLELVAAPGYLHAFLRDTAEQAQLLAERRDNQLECRFAGNLPPVVCADFRRLRQVLLNLLGNAAKFTHDGRIVFAATLLESPPSGQIRLQLVVEDSGIGIAADERDKLLLPFTRGRNALHHDGSGLGLAIVTQLLQLMDSRPQIDPSELGGTRFSFVLDLALSDESEVEPELGGMGAEVDVDGAQRTVLVVDDQWQTRQLLCDLLDGHGFNTLSAADGVEALELLASHSVDLLLTDQGMPGMDGWNLLQAVRANDHALPVVLYSALPPQRPPGLGTALQFSASVLKPAASGDLLRLLASILSDAPTDQPRPV